jgi:hypothetical protein
MTLEKSFDEINEVDLRELIDNQVSERKTMEYKEILPDNKYDSKKEFLADVSSFANTAGGHLLYGIREENGLPVAIPGIANSDFDSEILRLENLLRDGIQPRIPGISIRAINLESKNSVLLIRVPQNWSKPHVVNFQGHWRFYARNSAGKYPLDVLELKSAILATTALGERIRNFYFERLSKITSGETPISLTGKAKVILHIIPYSAFETKPPISFNQIEQDVWSLAPIYTSAAGHRYNLDGLVTYNNEKNSGAYTQIFRNGIIESVSETIFNSTTENLYIPSIVFERELIEALKAFISIHNKLSISPPSVLMLSLTGVQGYKLAVHQGLDTWYQHTHTIDRDSLLLPETIIEDYGINPEIILHPSFDAIWNSAGWPRSHGYDEFGEWGKGPNFRR